MNSFSRKRVSTNADFTLTVTPITGKILTHAGATSYDDQTYDALIRYTTTASDSIGTQWRIGADAPWSLIGAESLTQSVALVSSAGETTFVADGAASIQCRFGAGGFADRGQVVTIHNSTSSDSASTVELRSYEPGSTAAHIVNSSTNLLSGKNSAQHGSLFLSVNHSTVQYVRDTNCIVHGLPGFAATSVWNSAQVKFAQATAVTPRHVICAKHNANAVGATYRWIAADNTVVTRTTVGMTNLGNDLSVFILNADLPASIAPAQVLPADFIARLPNLFYTDLSYLFEGHRVPMFSYDQYLKVYTRDLYDLSTDYALSDQSVWLPTWTRTAVGGDSGNPSFLMINGQLVLTSLFYYANAGDNLVVDVTLINNVMASLSSSYSAPVYALSRISLSGFSSY